jgi:creatinine amidohydrolase
MRLADIASPDAADADTDLALLPVGSTEQHGPHAPLGTDTHAAAAVAAAGAEAFDGPVAVAPPIPVGVSEEHRAFAGTLWVSPDAFRDYVREVAASLAENFARIVVVNGHGGNAAPLREVCARLTRDGDARAVPFTWFDGVDDMGHAGPVETSVLLYTHPDLVREGRIEEAAADAADRWGDWVGGANVAYDAEAFAPNGVVGDPRDASAGRGEELLAAAGAALAELLDRLQSPSD